jgi:hypothetical protein
VEKNGEQKMIVKKTDTRTTEIEKERAEDMWEVEADEQARIDAQVASAESAAALLAEWELWLGEPYPEEFEAAGMEPIRNQEPEKRPYIRIKSPKLYAI